MPPSSKWLRGLDLKSAGMPRRVVSHISCTAFVNCAISYGVTCAAEEWMARFFRRIRDGITEDEPRHLLLK